MAGIGKIEITCKSLLKRLGILDADGLFRAGTYTVATLPSASTVGAGTIVYVSDGAAGLPVLAISDGAKWLRCDTLTEVSWTPARAIGLVAWWDLTSTSYLSMTGDKVMGAMDRSGNGHHLSIGGMATLKFNATRFGPALGGVDFFAATPGYLKLNSAPVSAAPIQVYAVVKANNVTADHVVISIGDKDVPTEYWVLGLAGNVSGDPVRWAARSTSASFQAAVTSSGYTAGTTLLVWGLEASPTSRSVLLNGASKGTNSVAVTPANVDRVMLGAYANSWGGGFLDGSMAEVVLLNTDSTADRSNFHNYFAEKYGLTLP